MFRHFFLFELRYYLRGMMVWIFFLIIGALILGAASSDNVRVGGAVGNVNRNAPFVVQNFYAVVSVLTLLMTTAFANSSAIRDFQYNTHQIIFSLPISRWGFLLGRFWAAVLVSVIPALGVSLGVLLAPFMPWADAARFGSLYWTAHANGLLCFVIPNTILTACVLFPVALRFRSTTASFLSALLLLVVTGVAETFTSDLKNEFLAAMLEPFGGDAFALMTKYWTSAERNTMSLGLSGVLLWNRLAWLGAGLAVFFVTVWKTSLGERQGKRSKAEAAVEAAPAGSLPWVRPLRSRPSKWAQFAGSFAFELRSLVKTPTFIVILAAALINTGFSLVYSVREAYGNKTFLVTYTVTEIIQGTMYVFLIAIITYFAGQLIWRDREARTDELLDCLPTRDWMAYLSKFTALALVVAFIQLLAVAAGVIAQTASGYTRFQPEVYVGQLFVRDWTSLIMLCVAAFLFHAVSPNKYVGYFAFIAFLIWDTFGWRALDVETNLVDFGSRPSLPYSDFFAFRPGLDAWLWFSAYWITFCLLLAAISILLFPRGKETDWAGRLRVAWQRWSGLRPVVAAAGAVWLASGVWIFYNTKILNDVLGPKELRTRRADYEKTYKKLREEPQPRITAVRFAIDLIPERRAAQMRVAQTIVNRNSVPVPRLYVNLPPDYDAEIDLTGAVLEKDDRRLLFRVYRLEPPIQPGESRTMEMRVRSPERGFSNTIRRAELVQNGTFFNNGVVPSIGYDPDRELSDRNERRKQGLPEKDRMPALRRDCGADCANTYLSRNSDWVSVETVISTSGDQLAVAPGSLVKEWQEGGRRYFQYRLDHKSVNFYSFISARYEVRRDDWNGVKVEIYHHPEHRWNVARMVDSVKKTLAYCTENFGPYHHKQARIIEFPRIASFAQAFPGTMPYSESIGFIADLRDPENIDHVFYVVAHEMGHQWWAHQVIGAGVQGATLLSETLAQYTALMVMEREYGRDMMRKFLEFEMDRYLRGRGGEQLKELPLLRVESNQGYIHYNKGSLAMYYLKELIGEAAVNRALREVVERFAYQGPPYPTSYELVDRLRAQTPTELQSVLVDLFDEITLFSNRALEAKARKLPDGRYEVTLQAEAKKLKADEKGNEREVPIDDWVEIGAFAKPEKGKKYGATLHRERIRVNSEKVERKFVVEQLPDKAGIDPFHLLVDRQKDDNVRAVDVK
jgi:ABC-type transport system involved in multi-copper enzyme maturation permease subunit